MEGKVDEKLTVDEEASASSRKRGREQVGNASRGVQNKKQRRSRAGTVTCLATVKRHEKSRRS